MLQKLLNPPGGLRLHADDSLVVSGELLTPFELTNDVGQGYLYFIVLFHQQDDRL